MHTPLFGDVCPSLFLLFCQLVIASPAGAQEVQYRVSRETAGYIEQRGWENGLVRANPNLSHFNWSPMTTMIQAPVQVRVGTEIRMNPPHNREGMAPKDGPGASVSPPAPVYVHSPYIKPDHVATAVDDTSGQVLPRHYVKPIKADLNGSLLPRRYVKPIHEDVAANLLSRNTSAQVVSQAARALPTIASYGELPHIAGGNTTKAKADVNGSIVSRGQLLRSQ